MRSTAAVALLSTILPAQITLEVRTSTDFVVEDSPVSGPTTRQTIKKDQVIQSPTTLAIGNQSATFVYSNSWGTIRYEARMNTDCSFRRGTVSGGVMIWIKSRMAIHGRLTLRIKGGTIGSCFGGSANTVTSSAFPLTVFTELNPLGTGVVPLDSKGIWVEHTGTTFGNPSRVGGGAWSTIEVEFTPDVDLTGYGAGCGPALIARHDLPNRLTFSATGLSGANTISGLIVGSRSINLPIPGTPCFLLTDPLVAVPWTVSPTGTASAAFVRPQGAYVVYVQAIGAGPGGLESSNGIRFGVR